MKSKPRNTVSTRRGNARRQVTLSEIRQAVADYMYSEGCSCCENTDAHDEAKMRLGKMLRVTKHSDKSDYNFYRYRTEANKKT